MNGSGEYHAKQNKSDGKEQEPYDFTHMWYIKQKATSEQIKQTCRHTQQCDGYQRRKGVGGA